MAAVGRGSSSATSSAAVLSGPVGCCQAVGVSNPAEIQRTVRRLDEDVAVIVEGMARVEATQETHTAALVGLRSDLTELRSDVSGLRSDVTQLRSGVSEVLTLLRGGQEEDRG
jgi:hypothetical protein